MTNLPGNINVPIEDDGSFLEIREISSNSENEGFERDGGRVK